MTSVTPPPLSDPDQAAEQMLAACTTFVREEVMPRVQQWDRDDVLPDEVLARVAEIGVPGAMVPARYGGAGISAAAMVDVWRVLARGWISLTGAVNTTHLGTALLLRYGTDAQRERWLPQIAAGDVWSSFSITEPQAGSDLQRLETTVQLTDDGLSITGDKRWIAGGVSFPLTFMMAEVAGDERPSCIVLPSEGRGSRTWTVQELDKIGYRGVESASWHFDHHRVPGAEILGGADGRGKGARQMIDVLAIGRVNVACRALGIIDRALECALDEASARDIGSGVLGDYSHAQLRLGEMRLQQRTVEAIIRDAAASIDAGDPSAGERSTAAKVTASQSAIWAVETAARLAASRSYTTDTELSRLRRDAPQTQIGEGANDALLLATGKALLKAHADAETQ